MLSPEVGLIYKKVIKRLLDIALAIMLLPVALPLVTLASLWIVIDDGFPVHFSHERIGYKNRPFKIIKLRTMCKSTHDEKGVKLDDYQRVTRSGKLLRRLSIDELPQLLNILKGDMSFIGPRPLLHRYLPYYTQEELQRHNALPGVTGLAQINGRSDLGWEDRFRFDLEYVDHISFSLDLMIFLKTILKIVRQENTSTIRPASLVDLDEHRDFEALR